ncbi:hypothetical protein Tco_0593518, partial [Tanacetum coccineum]
SDSKNDLPSCDDFSSIKDPRDDSVTFSNPLFEFDVNFHNPLFDEEDIKCKDSYDSNLDESTFLVTPPSDSDKDECLTPGDDIKILFHHDSSTHMKSVASILEGFIDDPPFEENDELFDLECKTNDWKRILYDDPIDKAECFDPGGDNDEIDAFLAIEVPTYIEEGYYDSEGDVLYLESLLSDDNTHNLSPKVFFDHEPQHNTFSPKSDPLHHEFTGELITIPPRIVREHEEYLSHMLLLCSNSSSQPTGNLYGSPNMNIELILASPIPIKNNYSIPENETSTLDQFLDPSSPRPPPEPPDVEICFNFKPDVPVINNGDELNEDECFDPGGGEINVEVDNSFTLSFGLFFRISLTLRFLPYFPPPKMRTPFLTPTSLLRVGGISSGWNFHVLKCLSKH